MTPTRQTFLGEPFFLSFCKAPALDRRSRQGKARAIPRRHSGHPIRVQSRERSDATPSARQDTRAGRRIKHTQRQEASSRQKSQPLGVAPFCIRQIDRLRVGTPKDQRRPAGSYDANCSPIRHLQRRQEALARRAPLWRCFGRRPPPRRHNKGRFSGAATAYTKGTIGDASPPATCLRRRGLWRGVCSNPIQSNWVRSLGPQHSAPPKLQQRRSTERWETGENARIGPKFPRPSICSAPQTFCTATRVRR